jgi:hypothetical protein
MKHMLIWSLALSASRFTFTGHFDHAFQIGKSILVVSPLKPISLKAIQLQKFECSHTTQSVDSGQVVLRQKEIVFSPCLSAMGSVVSRPHQRP